MNDHMMTRQALPELGEGRTQRPEPRVCAPSKPNQITQIIKERPT